MLWIIYFVRKITRIEPGGIEICPKFKNKYLYNKKKYE